MSGACKLYGQKWFWLRVRARERMAFENQNRFIFLSCDMRTCSKKVRISFLFSRVCVLLERVHFMWKMLCAVNDDVGRQRLF